jgi:hypothetical protein
MSITNPVAFLVAIFFISIFVQAFGWIDGPLNLDNCTHKEWCGEYWVGYEEMK